MLAGHLGPNVLKERSSPHEAWVRIADVASSRFQVLAETPPLVCGICVLNRQHTSEQRAHQFEQPRGRSLLFHRLLVMIGSLRGLRTNVRSDRRGTGRVLLLVLLWSQTTTSARMRCGGNSIRLLLRVHQSLLVYALQSSSRSVCKKATGYVTTSRRNGEEGRSSGSLRGGRSIECRYLIRAPNERLEVVLERVRAPSCSGRSSVT